MRAEDIRVPNEITGAEFPISPKANEGGPLQLFTNQAAVDVPSTQGVKSAGFKLRVLAAILELTRKTGARKVLDGFAGGTRVPQALTRSGYTAVSNDIAAWSEVSGQCLLLNRRPPAPTRA